jgi:ubiquinone/menaquinone biosynthesis C-methylase UbiE
MTAYLITCIRGYVGDAKTRAMDSDNYHLRELSIAKSAGDQRRIMPPIDESYRRILDVGCGAGQTLIASDLTPDVMALGVDIDQSALSLGRQIDRNIQFVCAKGEALPFRDECVDFVFSRVALPYMHLHKTLSEMWRVLRIGGNLWIVLHPCSTTIKEIFGKLSDWEIKDAIYRLYVLSNALLIHVLGKEFSWPFTNPRYESCQTIRGITKLLRRAGFEEIETEKSNFFVVAAKKRSHAVSAVR